jgi:transcriptional regulator with XRE-family HTH domain
MTTKGKRISVKDYIEQQIAISEKSQKQIAHEIGYDRPNVITMIKQGSTKLPINKVGLLARALNVDPVYLLRLVMMEYHPDTWTTIDEIIGTQIVTKQELALLKFIRKATGGVELELSRPKASDKLTTILKELAEAQTKDYESAIRATLSPRMKTKSS